MSLNPLEIPKWLSRTQTHNVSAILLRIGSSIARDSWPRIRFTYNSKSFA